MTTIYLVVLSDRHTDDQYAARCEYHVATKMADEMMAEYGNSYKWEQEENVGEWMYRHKTDSEDGPHIHVEKLTLR